MSTHRRRAVREITAVRMGHYGSTYPSETRESPGEANQDRTRFVEALLTDLKHYCDVFQLDMDLADAAAHSRFHDQKAGLI